MSDLASLPGNTFGALSAPSHAQAQAHAAPAPRHDFYCFIHKALRHLMSHTLLRLGCMDAENAETSAAVLDDVQVLLTQLRGHLQHENDFVHTAIEARRPGGARHTADDHLQHLDAIANLEDELRALRDQRAGQRAPQALRLYRHLAEFVGENLIHMQVEETQNNAALWALYDDAELQAIHERLLASVPPHEMALVVRCMAASLNDDELVLLFDSMRQTAPPPAFDAMFGIARSQLDDTRGARLARALGRAPVPGLVAA